MILVGVFSEGIACNQLPMPIVFWKWLLRGLPQSRSHCCWQAWLKMCWAGLLVEHSSRTIWWSSTHKWRLSGDENGMHRWPLLPHCCGGEFLFWDDWSSILRVLPYIHVLYCVETYTKFTGCSSHYRPLPLSSWDIRGGSSHLTVYGSGMFLGKSYVKS